MSKYAPQHSACRHAAHGNRQRISSRPWLGRGRYLSAGGIVGSGFFNPSPVLLQQACQHDVASLVQPRTESARRPARLVKESSKWRPSATLREEWEKNGWMDGHFLIKMQQRIYLSIYLSRESTTCSFPFFQTVTQFSSKLPLNLFN